MAARRAFELFLILALVSGCIGVDPCTDYDLMWMKNGQRSSDYYSENTETSICDAYLSNDTWYRFEHDAGNRLIERPVEPWHCGTQAPIWMNGTHPTDATEVTAQVFASSNALKWNGTIRIQLCNESGSEYFVYQLAIPPGCPIAYCVDAASRKQCIPPEIWLQDEFKCGEKIEASAATTVVASTEPQCFGWGQWGPWSDCTKTCDHGVEIRQRECCRPPCNGSPLGFRPCAQTNCEELPGEKDKGIVLSLQSATQDTMSKVVTNQQTIDTILRTNINAICSQNASICCGSKIESISSSAFEFVSNDDIYAATGFPKAISDGTVDYKIIANVNETVNEETCSSNSRRRRARQVQSTDLNFISFEVMEMAARNSAPDILKETGLAVEDYLDPATYTAESQDDDPCPVTTCIVPIVVCCAVIPVIAIIAGCIALHVMKTSKTTSRPTSGKDQKMIAPNMVQPYVSTGQTKFEDLPEKPS